jgi:hypothetical protein
MKAPDLLEKGFAYAEVTAPYIEGIDILCFIRKIENAVFRKDFSPGGRAP